MTTMSPGWIRRASIRTCATWVALCACDTTAHADRYDEPPVPATATADVEAAADRHVGEYRHAGGQAERDAVEAAIDAVVAEMNVFARGIARDRLLEANPVPARLDIARVGDKLAIAFDGRRYEAPLDGSTTEVTGITGDTLKYRVTVDEGKVRQHFVGPRGSRRNTLKLRGADKLRLSVKVTSESLPKPLEYTLTFKRK